MDKIISIKEARKILGKNYDELDDIQIENVINSLSFIAREMLEKASKGELPTQSRFSQVAQILIVPTKSTAMASKLACICHTMTLL